MMIPSKGPVTLKTNLADYPVTKALKQGTTSSPIVSFDFCGPPVAHDGFKGMVRDSKFDAGELAIITFLQAKAYGKPYVLLPAPISGRFQHHCIGYNAEYGELKPRDIESRKVGVRSYAQTTGLWVRGILKHEYGVDLDRVTWITFEDAHVAEYSDPANTQRAPKGGKKLAQMMLDGDITAAILGADMPKDPRVRTLVPEPHKAAQTWHERTGAIPINHMFAVHEQISRERPDVVREAFRMVVESRKAAPPEANKNIPPFGVEANRKALQFAIDWALEQHIIPRRLEVDELFDDATRGLLP
jgi:4,5-dihydroxyphthalate decarboxylase